MEPDHRHPSAQIVLDAMDVHVRKHGGDNAGLLLENHGTVAAQVAAGRKQILVESAIRSSSPQDSRYADPRVVDRRSDGIIKPGFNTTSHLNLIAELMEQKNDETLEDAHRLCCSIGDFTRAAIRRNLDGKEDPQMIRDLEDVVDQVIDRPNGPHSLRTLLGKPHGVIEQRGEDWQLVLHEREQGDWIEADRRSITGRGEELAQALSAKYFQLKGSRVGRLNIHTDAIRKIARDTPHFQVDAKHLRSDIALQIQCLFQDADVIVAGGYLPTIGSRRGYSDITGALIAQAVKVSGTKNVAYAIEKQLPIMSADPSRVKNAKTIEAMTYFLSKELFGKIRGANGGAIDPSAIDLAAESGIPIVVYNPLNVHAGATVIRDYAPEPNGVEIIATRQVPLAIEICCEQMIGKPGFLQELTKFFANNKISIDQVATSEGSISLTFTEEFPDAVLESLQHQLHMTYGHDEVITVNALRDTSLVFCLGNNMKQPGVASRAALALELAGTDIHLITQGLNECVMAYLIDSTRVDDAVSLLHDLCVILPADEARSILTEMKARLLAAVQAVKK